jgi:S1-C subfamily serine protease
MRSILLLVCPRTGSKGTAFVLKSGCVVTAAHVVEGSRPRDIVGIDAMGGHVAFSRVVADGGIDVALLRPTHEVPGELELAPDRGPDIGSTVWAWGFPFGYVGPTPLVSVGYIAGYSARRVRRRLVKQIVVNGAFNMGNSGGPLCAVGATQVVGLVSSKHLPPNQFIDSALRALADQRTGPRLLAVNARGSTKSMTQSEVVAEVLTQYRTFLQVMIGEAVAASEVSRFLASHAREVLPRWASRRR